MCFAFKGDQHLIRPGRPVKVWNRGPEAVAPIWAGFARKESLAWWQRKGIQWVDVPVRSFAEKSDKDGRLRWELVPEGLVVRGLLDLSSRTLLLKIVTRASTEEELLKFEHPRMPLIEAPLYCASFFQDDPVPQQELF